MNISIKSVLVRLLWGIMAGFMVVMSTGTAWAATVSQDDINSIYNDTVWYQPNSSSETTCSPTDSTLVGSDNVQKAVNFLVGDKGLTPNQAAGVIGNLEQESGQGLNPLAQQNGSNSTTPIPGVGFGIAQWTDAPRQQGLISYAQQNGGKPGDLTMQLGFLWQELSTSYAPVLQNLKATTSVEDAVNQFVGPKNLQGQPVAPTDELQRTGGYENPGTPNMSNRLDYARKVAATYGGTVTGSSGCSDVSVNCSAAQEQPLTTGLSPIRQNVVCQAKAELALWKSKPGYPNTPFSQSGYYKYSQGRPEEWCADFVSWIYDKASYPLQPDPDWNVAYVPNIQTIGQKDDKFHWHPAGSNYTPKPGDLAIYGATHVNIFISTQGGVSQYIGGDQGNGPYPGGSVVSLDTNSGYYGTGITGYVSPE